MKSIVFTGLIFVAFCVIQFATSIEFKLPKCRGQKIKVTVKDVKNADLCFNEGLSADGEVDDMACMGKCFLAREGLIDDKGMPSKENMIAKIKTAFTPDVVADMDAAIEKCVNEEGKTVDPNDKSCESYSGLTQCMIVSFVEVCSGPAKS